MRKTGKVIRDNLDAKIITAFPVITVIPTVSSTSKFGDILMDDVIETMDSPNAFMSDIESVAGTPPAMGKIIR